jgi:predicted nucleic acid binding AN1-type Zn finger protein
MTTRCDTCKKKLGIMEYSCKCGKIFCISHLQAEQHACTYDYRTEKQAELKKQMDVGPLTSKVIPI